MSDLDRLLLGRRLIVCVGPGGVGKTTIAAALALRAAQLGRRTLVLTIDPARRLASALGVAELGDAERPVPVAEHGGRATLHAAMLEGGSAYDALIARIADDPEHRARILGNRVYQIMSRAFGSSHAYVAMERLHDAAASGAHDLIVLDTPPTRNALDILDAPARLLAFLDERIVGWLIGDAPEGIRARLVARGGAAARRLLAQVAGEALVRDLSDFLGLFAALRPGFLARAAAVQRLLRDPETAFALVTTPLADNLADAAYLREGLAARGIDVDALVFNRAHIPLGDHPWSWAPTERERADELAALAPADAAEEAGFGALLDRVDHLRRGVAADNARGRRALLAFAAAAPAACHKLRAPLLDREPQDLRGLARLAALLADPRASVEAPR